MRMSQYCQADETYLGRPQCASSPVPNTLRTGTPPQGWDIGVWWRR